MTVHSPDGNVKADQVPTRDLHGGGRSKYTQAPIPEVTKRQITLCFILIKQIKNVITSADRVPHGLISFKKWPYHHVTHKLTMCFAPVNP